MQDEAQYSLLVWEDVSNLPLPDEIKKVTQTVKWDQFEWHAVGLPISQAKFSMSGGKVLYLSELPNGEVKVKKLSEFTGRIAFSGFFIDEESIGEFNYFITLIATIVKGEVIEVEVSDFNKQPLDEYKDAIKVFEKKLNHVMRTANAWWFKWLYRPWFFVVRGLGYVALWILNLFRICVIRCVKWITPI